MEWTTKADTRRAEEGGRMPEECTDDDDQLQN